MFDEDVEGSFDWAAGRVEVRSCEKKQLSPYRHVPFRKYLVVAIAR